MLHLRAVPLTSKSLNDVEQQTLIQWRELGEVRDKGYGKKSSCYGAKKLEAFAETVCRLCAMDATDILDGAARTTKSGCRYRVGAISETAPDPLKQLDSGGDVKSDLRLLSNDMALPAAFVRAERPDESVAGGPGTNHDPGLPPLLRPPCRRHAGQTFILATDSTPIMPDG